MRKRIKTKGEGGNKRVKREEFIVMREK